MRTIGSGRPVLLTAALAVLAALPARGARAGPEHAPHALSLSSVSYAAGAPAEAALDLGVLPEAADELELVLSLDGGRTFPVRLTASVSRRAAVRFVVPAIGAVDAVVAVRAGEGGEDEKLIARSAPFEIRRAPSDGLESLVASGGELWTSAARRGTELPSDSLAQIPPSLVPLAEELDAAELPAREVARATLDKSLVTAPSPGAAILLPLPDTSRPLSLPKRE